MRNALKVWGDRLGLAALITGYVIALHWIAGHAC
jgi:hypothetical protein